MKQYNHETRTEHNFDRFCKMVLKGCAIDIYRKIKRRSKKEVVFSDMSASELANMNVIDTYFADEYVFNVLGEIIGVADYELGEALSALPAYRRDIVLLSYFLGMTDKEIAQQLNMARRTVAHQRANILQELKKIMRNGE